MVNDTAHTVKKSQLQCYHCGETCPQRAVYADGKPFCCEGCKLVYDLLKENSLCTYYNMNERPGRSPAKPVDETQYAYLDHEEVFSRLIRFRDKDQVHITFYIPSIHCSSCVWLLENLHRLDPAIAGSSVNFMRREVTVIFDAAALKLSEVAALLAHTGYEPLISLDDLRQKAAKRSGRTAIIKIGIAGFCFGNIMMLSFPGYFSLGGAALQPALHIFFGYLNLLLSLPVFFYCASGFFASAWKSIRHRYLNIDAPIALAVLVTFLRSAYEILGGSGAGYMDSMSGIVFFMLLGRYFQDRTYDTLSFERDYRSYFPIGVTLLRGQQEVSVPVTELKKGDRILIRSNGLIPSDALLLSASTHIDYSFITGESAPVKKKAGELIYAGGRQLEGAVLLEVAAPVSQSYLTQLWNRDRKKPQEQHSTYVDAINMYFTIAVLCIALLAALYWLPSDGSRALAALISVLIVACPCGLLLTSTFANGSLLRILGRHKFYLKNAGVIAQLAECDTILFDKTGTITQGTGLHYAGPAPDDETLLLLTSLAAQSAHPLSRKICEQYGAAGTLSVKNFTEVPGKGITGIVAGRHVMLGSAGFVAGAAGSAPLSTSVFFMIDGEVTGRFIFSNTYRSGLEALVGRLSRNHTLQLVSGDNDSEEKRLRSIFGSSPLRFHCSPEDKMQAVQELQSRGHRVMMIGDGLNDAAALRMSDAGIAVSDDTNTFSPACDAILDGSSFMLLDKFIALAAAGKKVVAGTFAFSLLYNITGLSFAVTGSLSPVIAAVLMPASSISIVLLATVSTGIAAKMKGL